MSHTLGLDQIWSWNAEVPETVPGCVHDLIATIAVHHPDALAVCAWDGDLTYSQLTALSRRVAQRLIALQIPRQSSIPLLFSKTRWTCVAMLAIIQAGCAAVALDATQPDSRLRSIVQQTKPKVIISSPVHTTRASGLADAVILQLDDAIFDNETGELTDGLPVACPSDIVYISFTSGTTGQPKGACISHANVRSAVHHQGKKLGFDSRSRVFDFAPYSFDVAWSNFLHTLCAGGCICIANEKDMLNDLSAAITSFRATLINVTPTVLRTINPIPPTLETVLLSGEMPYRDNITRWADKVKLLNTYGPTECTFKCAFSLLGSHLEGRPDIGRGVGHCTWIVDVNDSNKLAAPGATGELFLEGPLVGQGYLSDPKKSADAFINDPPWLLAGHNNVPGRPGRLYRTGDLVKYKPDGRLMFMGRKDAAQLKIRGQRVEIGDVEHHVRACLDEDLSVIADVVMPRGSDTLSLALFVQAQSDNREQVKRQVDSLEGKLREILPSFMIPTVYLPVNVIPVAPTGKADRRRLREMGNALDWKQIVELQSTIVSPVEYREPTTDAESQLRHIWAQVLELDVNRISTGDSFLRLGGDSITAMYLVAQARKEGLSLTVADVFTFPILNELATKVENVVQAEVVVPFSLLTGKRSKKGLCETAATLCGVGAGEIEDIYPCTALQQGMLAISARDVSADYTSRTGFDLPEATDMRQLERAWKNTVEATPILRTRIVELPGEGLVQVVVKTPVTLLRYEYIRDIMTTSSQTSYLGRPLCRAGLIVNETPRLSLEIHHSIYDGWTTMLILDTLEMAYRATKAFSAPLSFQPFVKHVMAMDTAKARKFWRDQLIGTDATVFPPSKYSSRKKLDFNHVISGVQWPRTGTTPSSVVRSALAILLASLTNTDDVKYGATVSGRQAPVPDIERIAGPTIATVPVRVKLNWDHQTVEDLLQQVQRQMVETTEYEQFGLQHIQRIDEDIGAAAHFELLLVVQPAHHGKSQKPGGLFSRAHTVSIPDISEAHSQGHPVLVVKDGQSDSMGIYNSYAMMIICQLEESGAELKINFDPGAIEEDDVQRLARQFEHLLRQMCSEKVGQSKLRDLSPLTSEDLGDIWEWNRDLPPAATECVTSLIAQRADTQPGEIAICAWDSELTYRQLQEKSIALACRMREHGVTPGSIVVLSFEKSSWLVITMIAVLQLGCIALPVSAPTPGQRASQIVDALQPTLVITSTASHLCSFTGMAPVATNDELMKIHVEDNPGLPLPQVHSSDPALLLFTSGSTGTPKPIQWSHGTLSSNIAAAQKCFGIDSNSRVFQFAGYDFDVSTVETLSVLAAGGCVCIASESERTNRLAESVIHYNANWICLTPSVAESIAPKDVPPLKTITFAGEKLQQRTASQWSEYVDAVYNWYGPAEACVATSYKFDPNKWQSGIIGRSQAACTWLVDPKNPNILAPVGAIAELCIEGPIVASYTGSCGAALNEKQFISPSWLQQGHWKVSGRHGTLYRTGDLVKYTSDGSLLFLGRTQDSQRKLRGQRIDLEDIERLVQGFLNGRNNVKTVAEIFTPSLSDKDSLALFFSSRDMASKPTLPVDELEAYLVTVLPSYMIPKLYIPIATIPIGKTGKTDRRRLCQIGSSFTIEQLAAMQPSRKKAREPSSENEKRLQRLWAEVLGVAVDSIYATDNFLRLGGDSIMAMRLVALARNNGSVLTVSDIFEAPVLESMSERLGKGSSCTEEVPPFSLLNSWFGKEDSRRYAAHRCGIQEEQVLDIYPCTPLQEGLLALGAKNHGQYISRSVLEIQATVDPDRLRQAWLSTVQKLPILRTCIIDLPGQGLVQVLLENAQWRFGTDIETYVRDDEQELMGMGMQLCRAAIVEGSFILTIHHCTYDGATLKMILDELEHQYLGQCGAELTPFRNFIKYLQKTDPKDSTDFWKAQLSNIELQQFPAIPSSTYIPQANEEMNHSISVDWPRAGMTPSTILRSAWAILEAQYVASNNVVFGVTTSGRQANMAGIERCSGPTIATVPIAISIDWDQTIQTFLGLIQQQSISMIPHEQYGLQNIQRTVETIDSALFQTLLVIQPVAEGKSLQDDSLLFKARRFSSNLDTRGTDPFNVYPLMLICELTGSGVKLHISFDNHILDQRQIYRIACQFETVLRQLCTADPDATKLEDVQTASNFDIAGFWENCSKDLGEPQASVLEKISFVASKQPDSIAIDAWDGQLSYKQFDELSTDFAHRLLGLGISQGSTVALSMEKSKWVPIMQLAILKSGAVCLLQSVAVPEHRVGTVFKNLDVVIAVASPSRVDFVKQFSKCFTIEEVQETPISYNPLPSPRMTDPAIVLVSSGSTGEPKQILWDHRTLSANIQGAGEVFAMSSLSRLFQFASYDFDVATVETLSTLAYGGCLCIPSESERLSDMARAINRFEANVLHCTPSTGRLLSPEAVPTLSTLIQAGEKLTEEDVKRWSGKCRVINWYGPAECSLAAVSPATLPSWYTGVIASPSEGVESQYLPRRWLVDPHNYHRLVPFGATGEITLEGPACAVAYIGNPRLTEMAFCENPRFLSLSQNGNERKRTSRIYRTGDLARYDSNGNLIFIGRKDSQLKIRGQLVAPEEVEYHIRQCVDVAELPVVVDGIIERNTSHLTLVAFIVAEDVASITNGLNEKLQKSLPRYAIPSYYIPVRGIPTGPTGKVDRKTLREIGSAFTTQLQFNVQQRKPTTPAEVKLQNLWAVALGIEMGKISANDSFLRLGNSIEAMRFVGLARDQGILLTVAQVFERPILADMATIIQSTTNAKDGQVDPFTLLDKSVDIQLARQQAATLCGISEQSIEDIFPCTPLQEGLLSLTTKRDGNYTGRNILELRSSVDPGRFKASWEQTVARIPILRTRIIDLPGQGLVQVVMEETNVWTEAEGAEDYIEKEKQMPIRLGSPLMRCSLFTTSPGRNDRFSFALTMHHSIYDGVSTGLVLETLESLYHDTNPCEISTLQPFVQYINRQDKKAESDFWASQFAGLEASQFPALPHAAYEPHPDSNLEHSIRVIRWRTDDITPSTTIRLAFALLCSRYSDSSDVLFGTVVNGRSAPVQAIDRLAAPTIATLPIRVKLNGHESIRAMLIGLQSQATDMIPYEQSGLSRIQKINDEARQACRFQSFLMIQPPETKMDEGGLFSPQQSSPESERDRYRGFSSYAFSVGCTLLENGIQLQFTFDSKVIDHATVGTMAHHFEHLLRKVASHEVDQVAANDLEMITRQDLSQIWQWNSQTYESINMCIHDLITERAEFQPTATAISAWDGELTYQALDDLSTQLAHELVDLGVSRDPALPESRVQTIVQQVKPILMLASPANESLGSSMVEHVIVVNHDSMRLVSERCEKTTPLPSVHPSDLLYAVFTSGSTGTPKGVLIQHRHFCSAIFHQQPVFRLSPSTRMYDFSAPSFDVTYGAVLPTLVAGGTVCIPSDEERKSNLTESLRRFGATDTLLTPSIARWLDPSCIPTLRNIYLGGEASTHDDLALWTPHVTTVNCYGPAECSVGTLYWKAPSPIPSQIPIGKGYGVSTWVVDPQSSERLSPLGTVGELYLEGPLVGQGYFMDEEKTASAFIESPSWLHRGDPSGRVPGRDGRLYKTGDLVKYDPVDGTLVFMGRKNTQVKLRGQRIELGEIEHHLRQVLADMSIEASVTAEVVTPEVTGRAALVAFIESDPARISKMSDNLENRMAARVPTYMVPVTFVPINPMPLAPSGKTDRRCLREIGSQFTLEQLGGGRRANSRSLSTEQECLLQKWWTSVIGVPAEQISIDSSFLRLGGDSISAMRLASLARSQGISLTVQKILNQPRLCDMVQAMVPLDPNRDDAGQVGVTPFSLLKHPEDKEVTLDYISQQCNISKLEIQDVFPCTGVQKSLLSMTAKSNTSYIARFPLRLTENVDIPRLKRAWEEVSQTKAPILRYRIVDTPTEGLVQVEVNESLEWGTGDKVSTYIQQDQRPMGLSTPLTRLAIVGNSAGNDLYCLLTQHHAIYDGYSLNLLTQEVSRVYAGLVNHTPVAPFQSFIRHIMDIDQEKAREYWQNQFANSEAVPFPPLPYDDYHPKADSTVRREFVGFHWPKRDATASTIIRAAWSILTARYTDTDDVVFGTLVTGRQGHLQGLDRMIAPLINAVPVRVKFDPEQDVESFLNAIQQQSIDMIAYEQMELLDIRRINTDTERGSRFNTLLVVQPAQQHADNNLIDSPFDQSKIGSANQELDDYNPNAVMILCQLTEDNGLSMEISFDSKVVDVAQMERIASQFEHVLHQLAILSTKTVASINVVSPQDITQLWQWNAAVPQARQRCVHELIGDTVKRQPESPAICSWDGQLSYTELDMLSTSLASQLVALGAKAGAIIPLCFEKSMWHSVAALGVMKAGAACVAIDSTQPESRLRSIIQQVHPKFILTSSKNYDLASSLSDAKVVIVDRYHLLVSPVVHSEAPLPQAHPSDTIYVVFTSGSTGTPKGVVTTHQNFASAATHQQGILHIQSSSRVFDFVSYNFDVSWSNHLQTLVCGGCLCIPSESERRNDIPGAFNRMKCDYVYFTPSVARSLDPSSMPGIKCLAMGGEPIQKSDVVRWPQAEAIIGIYGPAECAQALSFIRLDNNCHNNHVGLPFGANMWLVEPGCPDRLAAIGAIGELLIEGPTVSQGYFADSDKTTAAYIKDPSWLLQGTSAHPGRSGRLYKTGDLLRYNSDGSFDFIGRKDGMIKLRGQRIELAEVEYHARVCLADASLYDGVAAEIIRPQNGNPLLAVFISLADSIRESGKNPSTFTELMEALEQRLVDCLPQYMIPGAYIPVDQIPMTTTNKTDRRALRELGNAQTLERLAELQSHGQKHREPSTEMEKRLQVLWSSVLGVEPASISADSNFLRIGGESIAAMRLVTAARLQSLSLTVAQIFRAPRLSQMALLVTQTTEEDEASEPQPAFSFLKTDDHKTFLQDYVEPFLYDHAGIVKDVIPCTDFQKRAVIDALQDPPGRLPIWIFGLPHNVDFARLEWACTALVHHFDILCAVFVQADGRFWQVLLDGFKPIYDTFDADDDVESFTRKLCEEDLKRPRQLGRSFIRFMAIRHQAGKHRLVFRIAHAQFDGYTWGMMIQTLAALYYQQSLPTQPTFRQFIAFNEHKKAQSLPYWSSRLRDYCHPSWSPASGIDAVYNTSDRMTVTTSFSMPNIQRHEGISSATFFHAACAIALSQMFGQEDVVFGRLVTGRSMLPGSLQNVVGPTMTEVPIIASIGLNDTIVTVALRLQAQFIDDSAHESPGMEEIIRNCTDWPEQVVDFGWRTAFQQEDEMEFKFLDSESTITVHEHDLLPRGRPEIYATPRNGRLHLEFEGNRRLLSEDTVREVFARIQSVLGEV
ncbi:hypothetical protein BDV27DRAFT_157514 [Aspergillus caelatus]|uniref:Carrier domain-containing protein n=1 Tax=Aspergillus caelatus TaxID=61420 RepID=A0A5N7A4K9_9EURO|nr:uncharacterized protein BDV27DRAFT_157514 [Aspergillus caelatus]KAE8364752.1 hypothetical protein BDV27DRAFT_157514 [Aspergillus caelatus]